MSFISYMRVLLTVAFMAFCIGCGSKPPEYVATDSQNNQQSGTDSLDELQKATNTEQIRTVLNQFDSDNTEVGKRPELTEAAKQSLVKAGLSPQEIEECSRQSFAPNDAFFILERIRIRNSIAALEIAKLSAPAKLAQITSWLNRMVYLRSNFPVPTAASDTLLFGLGNELSLAKLYQVTFQSMGYGVFFLADSKLKTTPAWKPSSQFSVPPVLGKIDALLVLVDQEAFVVDFRNGQVLGSSGNPVPLSKLAEDPKAFATVTASTPPNWIAYHSDAPVAYSSKMKWLETQFSQQKQCSLFIDLPAQIATIDALIKSHPQLITKHQRWAVENDQYAPSQLTIRYNIQEPIDAATNLSPMLAARTQLFPYPVPDLKVNNQYVREQIALAHQGIYFRLYYSEESPRQQILNGSFRDATSVLSELRTLTETARSNGYDQAKTEKDLNDYEAWLTAVTKADATYQRLRNSDESEAAKAKNELDRLRADPRKQSLLINALLRRESDDYLVELNYLLTQTVLERAFRAELRNPKMNSDSWDNTIYWLKRYKDSAERSSIRNPDRDRHIQKLFDLCKTYITPK
ncbi:MAG: hypothetical protein R3B84_06785 [Zavarzinella sp.]